MLRSSSGTRATTRDENSELMNEPLQHTQTGGKEKKEEKQTVCVHLYHDFLPPLVMGKQYSQNTVTTFPPIIPMLVEVMM